MALIACTWSGGIDSTALIGQLLKAGHSVLAISIDIYGGHFGLREQRARDALRSQLASKGDFENIKVPGAWLWRFSRDGVEIPTRNRRIIDYMIARAPNGCADIGLGEYIGADTWVVRDHVGAADADTRALTAYVYREYGLDWRLWTLSDFGEARFKRHRLAMGFEAGIDMGRTTNCLADEPTHCGRCYKCIERSVAFAMIEAADPTAYQRDPRQNPAWECYASQMDGKPTTLPADAFSEIPMPGPAL